MCLKFIFQGVCKCMRKAENVSQSLRYNSPNDVFLSNDKFHNPSLALLYPLYFIANLSPPFTLSGISLFRPLQRYIKEMKRFFYLSCFGFCYSSTSHLEELFSKFSFASCVLEREWFENKSSRGEWLDGCYCNIFSVDGEKLWCTQTLTLNWEIFAWISSQCELSLSSWLFECEGRVLLLRIRCTVSMALNTRSVIWLEAKGKVYLRLHRFLLRAFIKTGERREESSLRASMSCGEKLTS